jgi:hypothetical protein
LNASRTAGSASEAAAMPDSLRPTPKGRSGATAALIDGTWASRLAAIASKLSPAWMLVQ